VSHFALIAHLDTPLVLGSNSWLTLDSLLSAALTMRQGQWHPEEIPLDDICGLYRGSAALLVEPRPLQVPFISSLNPHYDYKDDPRKKVLRSGGPDKADLDMRQAYEVERVIWCGSGDAEACRELAETLYGVGKKVSHGFGEVRQWALEHLDVDRSLTLPNGTPARPVPASLWEQLAARTEGLLPIDELPVDNVAYKPDYWNPGNRALCVLPKRREISVAQMQSLEQGLQVTELPAGITLQSQEQETPIQFFATRIGQKMIEAEGIPGNRDKTADQCMVCGAREDLMRAGKGYTTLCPTCFTFGGTYQSIKRPGRMGAGWMGWVREDAAKLVTSVPYAQSKRPFRDVAGLDVECGKDKVFRFLHDVLMNPPEPPYLLFVSGNSSVKVMRNLAVTWSNRRVHISGNDPATVDATNIRQCYEAWLESGIPARRLMQAVNLRDAARLSYSEQQRMKHEEQLGKLMEQHDIGNLLERMPPVHGAEWTWLSRMMMLRERSKAGSGR